MTLGRQDGAVTIISCARCGKQTADPDKWDPEADTGIIYCDACWPFRDQPRIGRDR